jgi:hypothetical protein
MTDAVKAAVEAGNIIAVEASVEVSAKASPTGKDEKRSYTKLLAQNAAGMAAMMAGKIEPATARPTDEKGKPVDPDPRTPEQSAAGVCDAFNYGFDLWVRQEERPKLLATLEGPEKAIKASVKGLQAMGDDEAAIRARIKSAPKFAGVENIDKILDSVLSAA